MKLWDVQEEIVLVNVLQHVVIVANSSAKDYAKKLVLVHAEVSAKTPVKENASLLVKRLAAIIVLAITNTIKTW